jgi:peptide deformylase
VIHIPNSTSIHRYDRGMAHTLSKSVDPREFHLARKLCAKLYEAMRKHYCVGMSAPMLGVFCEVVVIERTDETVLAMVNPQIVRMHGRELVGFESCLSSGPINGCRVARMETIDVDYFDPNDPYTRLTVTLTGGEAVVAQHEIDHLTGTFFFDRVGVKERTKVLENIPHQRKGSLYGHSKISTRHVSPAC